MSIDQLHVGITALLWLGGLVYGALTVPKVSPIRRMWYYISLPLIFGFLILYVRAFANYVPADQITYTAVALRVLLFGVAMKSMLVPYLDRLELKARVQEIRVVEER